MRLFIFLLIFLQVPVFADFKKASEAYQSKKYVRAINDSVDGILLSFSNIISTTQSTAPYLNKARTTNVTYALDLKSKKPYFSFKLSYPIMHQNKALTITFDYSFEAVRYYKTYIHESQFHIPEGAKYTLISIAKNPVLWYPQDSIAYFVYSFANIDPADTSLVPGILLSIEFPKKISNQERDAIFQDIIQKISWKSLQDILSK
ncbi:MAG: hypothetical protein ACRCS8_02245 [Brevinema sp.]